MAVATAAALVGVGLSAAQAIKASSDKKKAENEMRNYKRQDLVNPYENMKLSTYGTDIMREDAGRDIASLTDAARGGGVRGVMGAIPRLQAQSNQVNQQIGANLEQQDLRRQYSIAQGEQQNTRIRENRDNQNLSAISSQYNAASQNMNAGIWGAASGLASAARTTDFGGFTPQVDSVGAVASQGVSMYSPQITAPKLPL
jgi:hypothetical protein